MPIDPKNAKHFLLHVHVCVHCGSAIRREELEGRAHAIGIFTCPKCGFEGPLNLEIREVEDCDSSLPMDE